MISNKPNQKTWHNYTLLLAWFNIGQVLCVYFLICLLNYYNVSLKLWKCTRLLFDIRHLSQKGFDEILLIRYFTELYLLWCILNLVLQSYLTNSFKQIWGVMHESSQLCSLWVKEIIISLDKKLKHAE